MRFLLPGVALVSFNDISPVLRPTRRYCHRPSSLEYGLDLMEHKIGDDFLNGIVNVVRWHTSVLSILFTAPTGGSVVWKIFTFVHL